MANKVKEKRNPFTPLTIVLLVFLILYCLSFFYLIAWTLFTSFKVTDIVYRENPSGFFVDYYGLLQKWDKGGKRYQGQANEMRQAVAAMGGKDWLLPFYSYKNILSRFQVRPMAMDGKGGEYVGMPMMYAYSFLYAGGCAFTATFVPCITAYACARFKYRFSRFIHTLVIIVMMIPIVGSLPSEIKMAQATGVMNSIWGLWIMRANFLGMYFLVFYDICKALPMSFSEAAKIDGANNFQIFFQIAMPLIRNTFFTVLLIKFIAFWNDYQAAMVFMPSYPTVAIGLRKLITLAPNQIDGESSDFATIPGKMATIVLTATPVCIVFAIFQKRLLGNLTVGGVKG